MYFRKLGYSRVIGFALTSAIAAAGCTQSNIQGIAQQPANVSVAKAGTAQAIATAPDLYRQAIGDNRFVASHLQLQQDGYTVESGNLVSPQGQIGSLVMVRAQDGRLTAFVSHEGKSGLLQVSAEGKQTFTPYAKFDLMQHDTVPGDPADVSAAPSPAPGARVYIDALAGFTQAALNNLSVDPVAYAKGQMEIVNLVLRNSKIENVEVRLAGVYVTDENIPVDGSGVSRWRTVLDPLRPQYQHDINVGFSIHGGYAGMAFKPGSTSVNLVVYQSFAHELGHNVGGDHCYPSNGNNYKHGYDAGGNFGTQLCGSGRKPYYSTPNPQVRPEGKVIGDAEKADMARLWREQAGRLSGYSPAFVGERMIYTSYQQNVQLPIRFSNARSQVGVVALSTEVGPTSLVYGGEGVTTLTVKLSGPDGSVRPVNLRAERQVTLCPKTTMNSYAVCHPNYGGSMVLTLSYHAEDNPELARGWYSGTVQLKAIDRADPAWSLPILVSLAVQR